MENDSQQREVTIIAAAGENDSLGKDNKLVWDLPHDLKRFKRLTLNHCVIMGRKTFESMPKALPNRTNIIITKNKQYEAKEAVVCHSLEEALALDVVKNDNKPFIIGGGEIYKQSLVFTDCIELTRIHEQFEADAFFPKIEERKWKLIEEEHHIKNANNNHDFSYLTYKKI